MWSTISDQMNIQYIDITQYKLLPHEKITLKNLNHMLDSLLVSEYDHKFPIYVDYETGVILDGHHRYHAAMMLGMQFVTISFVDYLKNDLIGFISDKDISKKDIVIHAQKNILLPSKTTKHYFNIENRKYFLSDIFIS